MIKRILLTLCFIFLWFQNSFAIEEIYWWPTFLAISWTANNSNASDSEPIHGDSVSATQFCVDLGGSYVSHTSVVWGSSSAIYTDIWASSPDTSIIDSVTCDMSNSWTYGSSMAWSGSVVFLNFDSSSWDYVINIPTVLFIISYIIVLIIAFSFLYVTTVFVWKSWKNISKKY